jgi:hypothetical protein
MVIHATTKSTRLFPNFVLAFIKFSNMVKQPIQEFGTRHQTWIWAKKWTQSNEDEASESVLIRELYFEAYELRNQQKELIPC